MDAAEYDTNTLLVSNIASVVFRIYESPSDLGQNFVPAALEIESSLRTSGHVVFYDPARRGIWHFQIVGKEGHDHITSERLDSSLDLCGYKLVLAEEGTLEPASLPRARTQPQQQAATSTPTSSISSASALDQSQRNTQTSPQSALGSNSQEEAKADDQVGADSKLASILTTYENFITALLLSISSTFCSFSGATPLNYRTVLLPPRPLGRPLGPDDDQDAGSEQVPVLATLGAYLTTTGALVVSFGLSQCTGLGLFTGSSTPLLGTSILAAPFGVVAKNQSPATGEAGTASLAQTPNTQALSHHGRTDLHDSLWKQACLKMLKLRGVATNTLSDCSWVNLVVSKPKLQGGQVDSKRARSVGSMLTIPWPKPLCFRKKAVEVCATSRVGETLLSGHEECHDPLANAKLWFSSAAERDEKMSKRVAERAATSKEASPTDTRAPKASASSPAAVRRPSTAAASAIYPTPPDGIQPPNGATPSFDGAVSSPGNPLSAALTTETDTLPSNTMATADEFDVAIDFDDSKRQRSDNNLLGVSDTVFGDMAGDMFGDNDITEADFNFFDEQPGELNHEAPMIRTGSDSRTREDAPRPGEPPLKPAGDAAPEPHDAVFAKPELKHARSSHIDGATQRGRDGAPGPRGATGGTKRQASPFDPHTVFKRVCASLEASVRGSDRSVPNTSRMRIFERMSFDPTLPMINRKYEQGGQFDYKKISSTEKPKLEPGTLPETDYLKRHGRQGRRWRDARLQPSSLMKCVTTIEPPTGQPSQAKDGSQSDDDDTSAGSVRDDSSCTTEEPTSPLKSSVKMATVEDDAVSQVPARDSDQLEEPDQQLAMELPRLTRPQKPEMPLSVLFSDPEPVRMDLPLADEDMIQVAQILTDQAAIGSLEICNAHNDMDSDSPTATDLGYEAISAGMRNAMGMFQDMVPSLLRGADAVSLKDFLDILDAPLVGQPGRLQPRQIPGRDPNAEPLRATNLYQIPGPHLEVCRADSKLSVLPTAVTFWESLGLGPSSGGKDVTSVCVFPGWSGMADNVETFLDRLKSVYETLKLGSLQKMPLSTDMEDGVIPYEVDKISTSPDATVTGHGSSLVDSMEILRGAINNLTVTDTNLVVYFVYSPGSPWTIVEVCAAFQRFFDSYRKSLASQKTVAANELVLQLVSADVLSSSRSKLVVTPPTELVKLCMQTYDRCTSFGGSMPAPAIRLEPSLPRALDFKLTVSPSVSLMRENSCIHVAYALSVDERWVTAAWTDDRGNQQETASYCLGRRGRPKSRSLNRVAREIWESTLDLISVCKIHWRIVITKCGPMDQQEIEVWLELARKETSASIGMMLMTVDTKPSLQLIPPAVKLPPPPSPFLTTPVSTPLPTPQPNTASPEQSGTPTTPTRDGSGAVGTPGADGQDLDGDAVLSDATEQTWGAVVGHRLNNSVSVLDLHPALVSGYLIKQTGTRIEDAPAVMEVNLVHTDASPRAYEPHFREMLHSFRALGTLARARGTVDSETDVRPWHVAAAEKGVRAMYLLM
ncbi:hypothetical protein RJ55_08490 [Drechmeria coniospora]|nr:hypothetical protein RJ55_08490 [Drechmeria coniospora]